MPIVLDIIQPNEYYSFNYENLSMQYYGNESIPYPIIKKFFSNQEEILVSFELPKFESTINFLQSPEENLFETGMQSEWAKEKKFLPWEMQINMCEDCTPPPPNVIIKPPPPPPVPPPPKLYYFTGINPVTKQLEGWSSTSKSSKRPDGASQDYLSVTRMA